MDTQSSENKRRDEMIKKAVMILILLVFTLFIFSDTVSDSKRGLPLPGDIPNADTNKFDGIKYGELCENEPKLIEIQIIDMQFRSGTKHYRLFHAKGTDKKPKEIQTFNGEGKAIKKYGRFFNAIQNYVSVGMNRGQKIKWSCRYPFTIFYGGRSILTTDKLGWAQPGQIVSSLQGKRKGENWYQTPDAWIVNNALKGAYKYFVSVYIPEAEIILMDDPETIVPPPGKN